MTPWLPPWVANQHNTGGDTPMAATQFQWQATHPAINGGMVTSWGGYSLAPGGTLHQPPHGQPTIHFPPPQHNIQMLPQPATYGGQPPQPPQPLHHPQLLPTTAQPSHPPPGLPQAGMQHNSQTQAQQRRQPTMLQPQPAHQASGQASQRTASRQPQAQDSGQDSMTQIRTHGPPPRTRLAIPISRSNQSRRVARAHTRTQALQTTRPWSLSWLPLLRVCRRACLCFRSCLVRRLS